MKRNPGLYDEVVLGLDGLSRHLGLPDERQEAMRLELRNVLGNAAVDGLMANPESTTRVLSEGLFDDALSEASKARRLSDAQTAVAKNRLQSREQVVAGLTAQALLGTAPDEAILAAERERMLAPAEAAQLHDANALAAERAAIRDARIQRVATLMEPLDPSVPEDRAEASDYWDSVSEVYVSNDAEAQRDNEFAFVERMGILPDGLARKYQGALLSTDATLAVAGANALAELQKTNPALVTGIPPERMRKAMAIAEFAALNLPPERAIEPAEQALENKSGTPKADPEIRVAAAEQSVMSDARGGSDTVESSVDIVALNIQDGIPVDDAELPADRADMLDALSEAIAAVLTERSGAEFNSQFGENYWKHNKNNPNARDPHPPFDEVAPSYTGRVGQGGSTYIRVLPKGGSRPGRWLMSPELFEKIREYPDATKILKDAFALEKEPEFFHGCDNT